MRPAFIARFLRLLAAECGPHVFNPWTQSDVPNDGTLNGPEARCERLRAHLLGAAEQILIGEASGYQGCHVSGIPFTSERLILAGSIPRVTSHGARLSTRTRPWSEPSATTVWNTLHGLGLADSTVLWNAFPWHPHQPGQLQSNRTPTRAERAQGLAALRALLAAAPQARLFAVGRHAEMALQELGVRAVALRHPSMGGARQFCEGLRGALKGRHFPGPP
jgi:hypothetical protein